MAPAMVADSNLEKILSAQISEIVISMSPSSSSSSAIKNKVPSPFYREEDSSSEDEWEEDAEVEVEIKEKDSSTVKRLSRYSLGYLDFSDHHEGRVEKTLWYKLMVKHNNIITEKRPPQPQPTAPPPRRLPASVRYTQDQTSFEIGEEEAGNLLSEWGWTPGGLLNYAVLSNTSGSTSYPAV